MRRCAPVWVLIVLALNGCSGRKPPASAPQATAFGNAIVEVSGGKQVAGVGLALDQPVVVQVNDAQGNAAPGAAVSMRGPAGVSFLPASGLTDSSGQFSTVVALGGTSGRYQIVAATPDSSGKSLEVKIVEVALGYQETLGRQLNRQYCARCHDPESTPERVSNYDNLVSKPHPFTEGETLNKLSDSDLSAIISHGGPALGKSPEMPPYGYTLSKNDLQALIAFIRAVSDPPYHTQGYTYAKN